MTGRSEHSPWIDRTGLTEKQLCEVLGVSYYRLVKLWYDEEDKDHAKFIALLKPYHVCPAWTELGKLNERRAGPMDI